VAPPPNEPKQQQRAARSAQPLDVMPGAVLRVSGSKIGVKRFLEQSGWKPMIVFWKGKPRFASSPVLSAINGLNQSVSRGSSLDLQVRDAKRFLQRQRLEFKRMKRLKLHSTLDFGVASDRDAPMKFYRFYAGFLSHVAKAGVDLELSHYAVKRRDDV